ncbi:Crp/Fnr family transcriptional regulator [Actinomadura sp. NTSP31]|uniref:Crp/Fnr family transcriptional regulator n=1 Tax=Actinomadura sp. NTSP31 TaxID=1735447 RepID=UPI0035C014DD
MTAFEPDSFFSELLPAERADLESRGQNRSFAQGEILQREGEKDPWVAVLLQGRVKAFSYHEYGGETLLAIRGPGALIGEVAAIDQLPHSANVAAMDPVQALVIPNDSFMAFLQEHGRVSVVMLRTLARRWRDADRKRVELGTFDATGRVAARLVEMAERFGTPLRDQDRSSSNSRATSPSVLITVNISQEELAGWVGASREAVSKALRTLRQHGWIETGRRRLVVHDLEALRHRSR